MLTIKKEIDFLLKLKVQFKNILNLDYLSESITRNLNYVVSGLLKLQLLFIMNNFELNRLLLFKLITNLPTMHAYQY